MGETGDYAVRAIGGNGSVRAFGITSRGVCEKARELHGTSPTITAALGRVLSGTLLMGLDLEGEKDLITVVFRGDGPVKQILATGRSDGSVKGYASVPDVDLPLKEDGHLDVGGAVGDDGELTVIRDLGFGEPYVGSVRLVNGEIAADLTYYFAESEQTPTSIGLGVLVDTDCSVKSAGGFMVQLLPGTPEQVIARLEKNLASLPTVTWMLEQGETPERILQRIMRGLGLEILDRKPVEYRCGCSRSSMDRALMVAGKEEVQEMIEKDGRAELTCDFCGTVYQYSKEELEKILERIKNLKKNS